MFEPEIIGSNDEICISNIAECESNSEEIERILSHMEIVDNFAFFDQMELIEN